jgi:hypothetical protein
MADIPKFLDHIRDVILAQPDLVTKGVDRTHIYRQFNPQVKDPAAPHIILAYEIDKRDVGLNVDELRLFISVHVQVKAQDAVDMGKTIIDALHRYTYADGDVIIHKMFNVGGPLQPFFDKELNHWETTAEFEIALG